MKRLISLLIVALFSGATFGGGPTAAAPHEITESYSFEDDMEGWTTNGIDLQHGQGFINWSIERSQEIAKNGNTSLKFYLENWNDAGKIWIERPFLVEANQVYEVNVKYALASRDYGEVNLFTLITGVFGGAPTGENLPSSFQGETGNGSNTNIGYKWISKQYEFTAKSDEQGILYVLIGVWGTYETLRSYYIDKVRITIAKKPEASEFYSFENDLEGWTANGTDLGFEGPSVDWSIARSQEFTQDGVTSIKFDLISLNGEAKIWIERPFVVQRKKTYHVNIEYGFMPRLFSPDSRIITGVFRKRPETGDDLIGAYQGKTIAPGYWGWVRREYDFVVKSKKSEVLYAVIGILGLEQAQRIYYLDSVCVTMTQE